MPESLKFTNLLNKFCTYFHIWGMKLPSVTKTTFLLEAFTCVNTCKLNTR